MKKLLTVIVLAAGLIFSNNAAAQVKIGYIRVDDMVGLMPETAKLDSVLQTYQKDSINPQYAQIIELYNYKDSVFKDSVKTPASVRQQISKELPQLLYQIQNWQQIVNQALQNKQDEYLAPLYRKVYKAIQDIAKEKKYTYILNKETLLVAPDADDISLLVANKLNLKIPKSDSDN
ncbi:MAG: OmpH family outer membrane protein [Chitinophagaceae bacterium]|nr:OmpH family outer membrane protein [Chitinophagaceae bacterium]MCB0741790.1 OmpH family outer membrane protein [Chitinophagaceae bacterium]HQV05565.1 OmpH family outer membrane protein [Chitinophagaceae bacterium]